MDSQKIGELLDSYAGDDCSAIVAAGLSMMFNDEITCRINRDLCDVFVYKSSQADKIAKAVLAIPTLNDNGEYDGSKFRFWRCVVYCVAAHVTREELA